MTPKFVRLIQNWSGHINTSRLVLFYVIMDYSREEGDAKNGNLVEEAYEYLVRNVYPVSACSPPASTDVGCLEYTANRRDNDINISDSKRSPALTLY